MKNIVRNIDKEMWVIIVLLMTIILLYSWLQYLITETYFLDPQFDKTQERIDYLHNENMQLEDNLLEQMSYTKIASEAALSGFIPAPFVTP